MDPGQVTFAFLEQCKRVLKIFNGYFFTTKAFLPAYIAFAQKYGLGWDLMVWEHGAAPQNMTPDCSFIVTIWERGAYFNPELKQSFFRKVKHHSHNRAELRSKHPKAKPAKLLEDLVLQRSKSGDIIVAPDCFGATLPHVCKAHNRRFIGFQGNPKWYAEAQDHLKRLSATPAAVINEPQQMCLNYG
jgi:hypothetical protein